MTCEDLPNAEMTVPKVTRDLLMLAPSLSLSPVSPVASALSLHKQNNIKLISKIIKKSALTDLDSLHTCRSMPRAANNVTLSFNAAKIFNINVHYTVKAT